MNAAVAPSNPSPWIALARPRLFFVAAGLILGGAILVADRPDPGAALAFAIISAAALFPGWLWCTRRVEGLPIYPLFCLGTLWTFALPLLGKLPALSFYTEGEKVAAALVIAGLVLAGTLPWFLLTQGPGRRPRRYLGLHPWAERIGLPAALLGLIAYNIITSTRELPVDPALLSLVRALLLGFANPGVFLLAYRDGSGALSRVQSWLTRLLILGLLLSTLPSALLVGALTTGALALIGFSLGRGRIPWRSAALFLALAVFLHAGKSAIREKYWSLQEGDRVGLAAFPAFFEDWFVASGARLAGVEDLPARAEADRPESFLERASLLHLFLRIQAMTGAGVPLLDGDTYAILPQLLVPRLLNERKARSHLGTYMLAVHYQLQTAEETETTTIGFGLINEALANFGAPGCLGLGAALGLVYGLATRFSARYPVDSFRALMGVTLLASALQNEYTAGVYVTVLFQGLCALLLVAPWALVWRRRP